MPFGQVPVLEIEGGVKIAQSMAVARYLAREFSMIIIYYLNFVVTLYDLISLI